MNIKSLAWTSLLIAIVLHLALFSLTIFVFQIDPVAFKPKFFFLGPILSKNDVKQISPHGNGPAPSAAFKNMQSRKDHLQSVNSQITDQTKNPFAIQAIKKPLTPQPGVLQKKVVIKSTFESFTEKEVAQEAEIKKRQSPEIKIEPYVPLKFRSP